MVNSVYVHLCSTAGDMVFISSHFESFAWRELLWGELASLLHWQPLSIISLCSCPFLCSFLKPKSVQRLCPRSALSTAPLDDFGQPYDSWLPPLSQLFLCISNCCSLGVHRHLKFSKSLPDFFIQNPLPAPESPSLPACPLRSSTAQAKAPATLSAPLSPPGSQSSYKSWKSPLLNITQNCKFFPPLVLRHRPSTRRL